MVDNKNKEDHTGGGLKQSLDDLGQPPSVDDPLANYKNPVTNDVGEGVQVASDDEWIGFKKNADGDSIICIGEDACADPSNVRDMTRGEIILDTIEMAPLGKVTKIIPKSVKKKITGSNDVPETVIRHDVDFKAKTKPNGQNKSYLDEDGNLIPANKDGNITVQQHVRGSDPAKSNSQYSSTIDSNGNSTAVKDYGDKTIKIDTKRLQNDIDSGKVNNVEIISPKKVKAELQKHVDKAQSRYDANPSKNNALRLKRAKDDLKNATRDNECLISGCVPSEYIERVK